MKNKNLISALIKFQAENLTVKRDAKNPHFKSTYASLDQILDLVRPLLSKHGLVITHIIEGSSLKTILLHESGESLVSEMAFTMPAKPQEFGSLITYLKRYSIGAMLALATDNDDDANAANAAIKETPKENPKENPKETPKEVQNLPKKQIKSKSEAIKLSEWLAKKCFNDGEFTQESITMVTKNLLIKLAETYEDYKSFEEFITSEAQKILEQKINQQ